MRMPFATVALSLALPSCGGDREGTVETDEGELDYAIDQSDGDTEIRFRGSDDEEVTIHSGSQAEADLPAGYDIYPGAQIVSNATINQTDGQGSVVVMTSADSAADMVKYYRRQAEAAGIEIEMEMTTNGSSLIGGESADGATFSFNASPGENGTTAQLVVGRGM